MPRTSSHPRPGPAASRSATPAGLSLHTIQGRRKYLTPGERARFITVAAAQSPDVLTLCLILAWTGCRISEALGLNCPQPRCPMSASDDAGGQKPLNLQPFRTDVMRGNGCEGVAMVVGVTLIDNDGPGSPLLQKLELQLKIASGIAYLGLLTMLQAREVREGRAKGRPRAVLALELAEDLARELPMRWGHDALTQTAEHSIKTETSFASVKAFNDSYRDLGKRVPIDQAARAAEEAWIGDRKRILRLLGIAALRAQVMFPGVRDIMANEGRYGEPKNPARPSAMERKLLLEPKRQAQLHLSPAEMFELAFHGSINPADLWLDHRLLHSVFEAAICAGRCREGKAGEMTRFGVLQLARCLLGDLREICVDEAMFAFCLDSYTAILKAFNAHADLEPEDLKSRLLTQIDAALAVPGELRDTIKIQPLAAPPTRPGT